MAFERPPLSQLVRRSKSDINSRLPGADGNLRASPEEVLSIGQAGLVHGLHGHIKWVSKQVLSDLSDDEFLVREASIYGLTKTPAVTASGPLTLTGTNGTVVPPTSTIVTRNDGVRYVVTTGGTVSGGQVVVTLTAVLAAKAGNCIAGTTMTLASPIAGINATGTVSGGGIVDGDDIESTDSLRARLNARKQNPPKGGGPGDYEAWALEVSGVTRAWQYPKLYGPGTVGLFFVRDGDISIIPDSGAVATVQAHLDLKHPVTAEVTALAPIADALNFTIHVVPDNAGTRAAVTAELQALLLRTARPPDSNGAGTILLSQIDDAIGIAAGVTDYVLTVPVANVVPASGHMAVFGVITWA